MRYVDVTVDLTDDCQIVPYEARRNPIGGSVGACLKRGEFIFLVLDSDGPDDGLTLASDGAERVLLAAAGTSLHVAVPVVAIGGLAPRPSDEYEPFVAHSLTRFFHYCESSIGYTIARLKTKRAGDQALIDKENVRLSIADYYRFLCLLCDGGARPDSDLNALAERVLRAADLLSNLLGGLSILHRGVVEAHLNYARWLRKLEMLR